MANKLPAVFIASTQTRPDLDKDNQCILSVSTDAKECCVGAILRMSEGKSKFEMSKWVNGTHVHEYHISQYGSGWNMYDAETFDEKLANMTPEQWDAL